MSSLGLPGPLKNPPGDAALHRSWNRFLDTHNLRSIFQASPDHIDQQCADILAALRVSRAEREALEDSILGLWDRIGLAVDSLPPDVNPHWRADEQLLRPTALRLAARRTRLETERELCEDLWDPVSFTLVMSNASKPGTCKGGKTKTLEVAETLVNTRYFLGHTPGDPIFSYDPAPLSRPADETNFTYRGRVPREPREDVLRLQLVLPKVLAQLVAFLAFFPERVSLWPAECREMMDEIGDPDDGILREIQRYWSLKFGDRRAAAPYVHFLRGGALVRMFAWLVYRACLDGTYRRSAEHAQQARRLWEALSPVVNILTSDRPEGVPACEALMGIVKQHVADEGRQAKELVFEQEEYDRALVYRKGVVINKSIHTLYASYTGRFHPIAGALFHPNPHPFHPRDLDFDADDGSVPIAIPDEVLTARDSIRARLELPPEPLALEPECEPAVAVAGERTRREREDEASAADDPEPLPCNKAGPRPPEHIFSPSPEAPDRASPRPLAPGFASDEIIVASNQSPVLIRARDNPPTASKPLPSTRRATRSSKRPADPL